MKKVYLFIFLFLTLIHSLDAQIDVPIHRANYSDMHHNLYINNRVITKVNGKAITVLDVIKRMDFIFDRQFSDLSASLSARFQFYRTNWKHFVEETINRELILADAIEKELPISDGDVSQELEDLFGPNIISSIDSIDLSYKEAWDMIKSDIAIRRMMIYRVHNKVMPKINPKDILANYKRYCDTHSSPEVWRYQVFTIRHPDEEKGSQIANEAFTLLKEKSISFSDIPQELQDHEGVTLSLSDEYKHTEKSISADHKTLLESLTKGSFSDPVAQTSRSTGKTVYRLFYLIDYEESKAPAFNDVEEIIKSQLTENTVSEETTNYVNSLRDYYGIENRHLAEITDIKHLPFGLR